MMIIDTHTHAFPDHIASIAIEKLENSSNTKSYLNGTIKDLLVSMDRAGIESSLVACVATSPAQFRSILTWCKTIAGPRIIPFPSVHPDSPDARQQVREIKKAGFIGLKLHPEFQSFYINEKKMYPIYQEAMENELLILFHCGHDISFPDSDRSSPELLAKVHQEFPELTIIASHLGGWRQWDKVIRYLLGRNVYLDTSYSLEYIDEKSLKTIFDLHPQDHFLFGTDSPWKDQQREVEQIYSLDIQPEFKERILGENAKALLLGRNHGGLPTPFPIGIKYLGR